MIMIKQLQLSAYCTNSLTTDDDYSCNENLFQLQLWTCSIENYMESYMAQYIPESVDTT